MYKDLLEILDHLDFQYVMCDISEDRDLKVAFLLGKLIVRLIISSIESMPKPPTPPPPALSFDNILAKS